MKTLFFLLIAIAMSFNIAFSQGTAINLTGAPADSSAILDLSSNNQGLLLPRLTVAERMAIASPAKGLVVYNLDCDNLYYNAGSQASPNWIPVTPNLNIPAAAGNISGSASVCQGQNNVAYSVAAIANATAYSWSYSGSGATISGSVNPVSINFSPSATSGNLTVTGTNVCGNGAVSADFAITVYPLPAAPTTATHVPASSQITWNWNTVPGATAYYYNTINDFGSAIDNGTNTSYTQTGLTCNTAYTLYVWAYNTCGNSSATSLNETTSSCCTDTWTQKADFGGTSRLIAAYFVIGGKGYAGTGYDGSLKKDFWEWDQATNSWTQKADFGGSARRGAVGFAIGTKGYIGTGYDAAYLKDFWEWDQAANIWTRKTDFGGTGRFLGVSFAIGTKGYIGTGYDGNYVNDFWEYDQALDSWTRKADFGGAIRDNAAAFAIGTKGYIGTGNNSSNLADFWEWDQSNNTWTRKADFAGGARGQARGFSVGTKGYIGTGWDGSAHKSFYEWNQANNTWTQKADFGGVGRLSAIAFSVNGKGYIGLGFNGGSTYYQDFWEYCP